VRSLKVLSVCILLTWCASQQGGIPTSSDANVSSAAVTAKGGTIACASGAQIELDPQTGMVTKLSCPSNLAWTDPPTEQEISALSKFGESLIDTLMTPFYILAGIGRAMAAPVAP
jgi:hypothetical protein